MLEKFGLDFAIVDSTLIKRLRRQRGAMRAPSRADAQSRSQEEDLTDSAAAVC